MLATNVGEKKRNYCICAHFSCHRISGAVGVAVRLKSVSSEARWRGRVVRWTTREPGLGRLANSVDHCKTQICGILKSRRHLKHGLKWIVMFSPEGLSIRAGKVTER